jgi:FAD:protein FMN transferase
MKSSERPTSESRHPDRRQFIGLAAGVFAVAALPAFARNGRRSVQRSMPVMGTIADLTVVHPDERFAHHAIDAAFAELRRVEAKMTRFSTASDIGRSTLASPGTPVVITRDTAVVIEDALRWATLTDGDFDPAIGAAVELWADRIAPPAEQAVGAVAARRLYRMVEVSSHRGDPVVLRHDADARLDLGGIAKGYGVDRAAAVLRDFGVTSAMINVGGDLYAIGKGADGDPWRVGIQSPDDSDRLIGTALVADEALATSGTYRQFFRHRGRVYHHLLDPDTGAPRATVSRSLTIRASTCMEADVAATGTFGRSEIQIRSLLARSGRGAELVDIA